MDSKITFDTVSLIEEKFKDKKDKAGKPYIYHLYSVEQYAIEFLNDFAKYENDFKSKVCVTALLHDIFEDTDTTDDELKCIGITDEILEALHLLTHERNFPYDEYIKKLSTNKIALIVKFCDIKNNLDITRLEKLDEKDLKRLNKYLRNYHFLKNLLYETN